MIIDSSAIVAILLLEPEREALARVIADDPQPRMSAATYLETAIVVDSRRNPVLSRRFDRLLLDQGVELVAVTPEQARVARAAYQSFGKGSGHPAGLNFGDCFSYALATDLDEPLLYKGDDFVHTDVTSALA